MTRLLVVEDDDDVRETVAYILSGEGHDVLEARNGVDALEVLRKAEPLPDVILLDLMMPVMDGAGFRAEQRRDPRIRDIPVVLVSASTKLPEIAAELDVAGVLLKPVSFASLVDVANRHAPHATGA